MIKHIKTSKNTSQEECLELLRLLSDQTRQEIILIFAHSKELCANDIANNFSLSRPTISHHLNIMKRAGVLNSRKDGKEIYYSFNKKHVLTLLKGLVETLERCC